MPSWEFFPGIKKFKRSENFGLDLFRRGNLRKQMKKREEIRAYLK